MICCLLSLYLDVIESPSRSRTTWGVQGSGVGGTVRLQRGKDLLCESKAGCQLWRKRRAFKSCHQAWTSLQGKPYLDCEPWGTYYVDLHKRIFWPLQKKLEETPGPPPWKRSEWLIYCMEHNALILSSHEPEKLQHKLSGAWLSLEFLWFYLKMILINSIIAQRPIFISLWWSDMENISLI